MKARHYQREGREAKSRRCPHCSHTAIWRRREFDGHPYLVAVYEQHNPGCALAEAESRLMGNSPKGARDR